MNDDKYFFDMIFIFCMVRYRYYEQKVLKIQNFDENKDFISNV